MLNLIWILNLFKSCWRLNDIVAQSSLVPKKKSKSRRQAQLVQKQKNKKTKPSVAESFAPTIRVSVKWTFDLRLFFFLSRCRRGDILCYVIRFVPKSLHVFLQYCLVLFFVASDSSEKWSGRLLQLLLLPLLLTIFSHTPRIPKQMLTNNATHCVCLGREFRVSNKCELCAYIWVVGFIRVVNYAFYCCDYNGIRSWKSVHLFTFLGENALFSAPLGSPKSTYAFAHFINSAFCVFKMPYFFSPTVFLSSSTMNNDKQAQP